MGEVIKYRNLLVGDVQISIPKEANLNIKKGQGASYIETFLTITLINIALDKDSVWVK